MNGDDLADLAASWRRHLEADRKSPQTIRTYLTGVDAYIGWCAQSGRDPDLDEDTVVDWVRSLHAAGRRPSTVVTRQAAVRRFSRWLARRGHIGEDQLRDLRRPKIDEPALVPLTEHQIRALLDTCRGKDFRHIRDRAIIRLLHETGLRASELCDMTVADVDLDSRLAVIRRGKGGKGRLVRFSPQCNAALDDYLRARRRHQLAGTPALWLGERGHGFSYWALHRTLRRRGSAAGIEGLHPHQLRSTAAVRWLAKGGSTTGLMAQSGWTSIEMLRRYIRAAESHLAAEEADRLDLGDV